MQTPLLCARTMKVLTIVRYETDPDENDTVHLLEKSRHCSFAYFYAQFTEKRTRGLRLLVGSLLSHHQVHVQCNKNGPGYIAQDTAKGWTKE